MSTNRTRKDRLRQRLEVTYASIILSFGMIIGIIDIFLGISIPLQEHIMVAVLLFGVVEIPRIEDVPSEAVRIFLTTLLAVEAILYIQVTNPDIVAGAATTALILLFGATTASTFSSRATVEKLSIAKEHGPYLGLMFGLGALSLLAI